MDPIKSAEDLKKLRENRYPAYVNKMAVLLKIAPYFLMPLWTKVASDFEKRESNQYLSDLSTYIKVSKEFREVIISKELLTIKDIERYVKNAPTSST